MTVAPYFRRDLFASDGRTISVYWQIIAVAFICVGIGLLLHHGWKHYFEIDSSDARKESCLWVCYFQPKDLSHFKRWSLIILTNAFRFGLADSYAGDDTVTTVTCIRSLLLYYVWLVRF